MAVLPKELGCAIVGGGPAGAVLAGLLAEWGHSVLLVDDGRQRRAMPEETILPAALEMLARIGVLDAVRSSAGTDPLRHGALWGSDDLAWQPEGEQGLRVVRGPFDRALRAWARARGAVVLEDHCLSGPLPPEGRGVLRLQGAGGERRVAAELVVVAAGRSVPPRSVPFEQVSSGPPTAALCLQGPCPSDSRDVAVVEAVPEGWLWWMPLALGGASVGVFVDLDALRQAGRRALLAAAFAHARGPARQLAEAPITHAVVATPQLRRPLAPVLLVGDAAATIDPLASQGVEKALAAADAAACAVHTALERPALRAMALAEHFRWERGLWQAHGAVARAWYAREARFAREPFWARRRDAAPGTAPVPPAAPPPKLCAHPRLRRGTALRRVGRRFEPEPGWALPGSDEYLGHLGPVAVAPLVEAFGPGAALADGLAAAARDPRLYVLSPRTVREAIVTLWQRGYLTGPEAPAAG